MSRIVAFDLETVPDVDAGRRIFGFSGTDTEVADALRKERREATEGRTDFLKPGLHRVVAIGLTVVTWPDAVVKVHGQASSDERSHLELFFKVLRGTPQLVSWNGGAFDLPVLMHRAMLHGVDASLLYGAASQRQWDAYLYRYGEAHVDLMEVLSNYGAAPRHALDEVAKLLGLPGKTDVTGPDVAELVAAGEWERIRRYVERDAVQTALPFLRWQRSRDRLGESAYRTILTKLSESLEAHPDLQAAIARWVPAAPQLELAGA